MKQAFIVLQITGFGKQQDEIGMLRCKCKFYSFRWFLMNIYFLVCRLITLKHNKKSALVQALPDLLRPATCGIPAKKVNI
ncbi:hypothetical protein [Herbaspirillum aquaticum]|uniref:hypothetical protein n=1 Tax=Herbaspirillum aquaticum TaxID=568783 RepID=UPI0011321AF3|nr:hypothetical protein [Herbaspirillum aquaticum]